MGYKEIPLSPIRKLISEKMFHSLSSTAQYTENLEVDASLIVSLRESIKDQFQSKTGLKLTLTHFFVMIVAEALKQHPLLNATFEEGKIKVFDEINMGVAFALKEGLIVPVLKNVEAKTLIEVVKELDILSAKISKGSLTLEDVSHGTFTITNLGMYGIDSFTPIINIPQVAILGINVIKKKPIVIEGKIEIREITNLSLTCDHRIVDGAVAAQFLQTMNSIMQDEPKLNSVFRF
jgi:pyruvate dehydrogenase E2 component (dihydrolipoamide acetyltransferase)